MTAVAALDITSYLDHCGGRDIIHCTEFEDMKDNFEDARLYATELRKRLTDLYGSCPIDISAQANRVILSLRKQEVDVHATYQAD